MYILQSYKFHNGIFVEEYHVFCSNPFPLSSPLFPTPILLNILFPNTSFSIFTPNVCMHVYIYARYDISLSVCVCLCKYAYNICMSVYVCIHMIPTCVSVSSYIHIMCTYVSVSRCLT